jgi:hypothetical protein
VALSEEEPLMCNTIGDLDAAIQSKIRAMSLLASALSEPMTNSSADLFVLERGADT